MASQSLSKEDLSVDRQFLIGEMINCLCNEDEPIESLRGELPEEELQLIEMCRCGKADVPDTWIVQFANLINRQDGIVVFIRFMPCNCSSAQAERKRQMQEANAQVQRLARCICSGEDEQLCCQAKMALAEFFRRHNAEITV